jgi:capsular exopolysaccharide synthesis family protein
MSAQAGADIAGEGGGSETSIADMLAMLRRRWILIACITLTASAVAIGYGMSLPNLFDAVATVLIDPRKKTIVKDADVVSELPADTPTMESEVEVLASKSNMSRVIDLLDLRHDPEFNTESLTNKILRKLGLRHSRPVDAPQHARNHESPYLAGEPERDEVLDVLGMHLKVQRRRNTYLIEVIATSKDPVKAARIANVLVDSYLKQQLEIKTRATGTASGWLEQKLDVLRQRLVESERAVAMFKAEHGLIDTEHGQRLEDRQIARLMEQVVVARTQLAETRAKYAQVQKLINTPGARGAAADVLDSHTVRLLKDQLVKVTRREAELETRYGPRHPEILKIKAELKDVEKQIEIEVDQILANYKSAYEVAEQRERSLTQQLDELKSTQAVINDASVKLRELEREAGATKAVYEGFLARSKQTAEHQSMQLIDARLVEAATVPLAPAGPKRKKIAAMGLIGGLVVSLGLVFLFEMMAPGLARPEEFEAAMQLPHLGSLPDQSTVVAGNPMRANRLILARPEGPFAEAVRSVRHALDERWRNGQGRMVMLASALPGEGKTAVASNVALHYSLTGTRTLLIDCDMRRASLTRSFLPHPVEFGLFECMTQRRPIEQAILRDHATGLCFLPAHGAAPPTVSVPEMLASPALEGILLRLRRQFDVIIVDCPPILPVIDARIIADHVDQIVFIAKWRAVPKEQIRRALRLISVNGNKLTGFAINQIDQSALGAAYGYGPSAYRAGRRRPTKTASLVKPTFARGEPAFAGMPARSPA